MTRPIWIADCQNQNNETPFQIALSLVVRVIGEVSGLPTHESVHPATAGAHVHGLVEQGSDNRTARFCGLEHDGDGRGFHREADHRRAARCAARFAGAAGQFCSDAARSARFGQDAQAR